MVGTADAQIANSGLIEGGNFGILSGAVQLPGDTAPVLRAVGTDIVNSGTIVGQNNDAIRLVGGGTVVNSGIINGQNFVQADGVNMFADERSEEHTSELQSLMRISYAVFCLKKKKIISIPTSTKQNSQRDK